MLTGSAPANEEEGEDEGPAKFESAVAVNEEAGAQSQHPRGR